MNLVERLSVRLSNLVSRAVVKLANDKVKIQLLQLALLDGEVRDEIERFQQYGFTSNPQAGAEAVVLFPGGRRDHGLAVCVDDRRYRIKNLKSGEVAVYTDEGDKIVIKRGGTIEVTAATKVIVSSPMTEVGQPASDAMIKGTTYRSAEDTLITALNVFAVAAGTLVAALTPVVAVPPPAQAAFAAAVTAFSGAVTSFQGAASNYLSTKAKVG